MNNSNPSLGRKPDTGDERTVAARNTTDKVRSDADQVREKPALEIRDDPDYIQRMNQQSGGEFKTAFSQYKRFHPFA
jgi:hypothetical protein